MASTQAHTETRVVALFFGSGPCCLGTRCVICSAGDSGVWDWPLPAFGVSERQPFPADKLTCRRHAKYAERNNSDGGTETECTQNCDHLGFFSCLKFCKMALSEPNNY